MNFNESRQIAIDAKNLNKHYGEVKAVDGISFQVIRGEFFGFLGPNGAGKTTTINLLTGLARLDQGSITIGGIVCSGNPKAAQHLVGVVPDESNLYQELSGFDNLCFCAALYGMKKHAREARAQELLKIFGLYEAKDRKFSTYSKGMKRKLTFAAGIIHNPDVLFLDEPTTGIDVASARQVRQIVAGLHDIGTTVFLTTHYIEEAERLCERIAFIVKGKIVKTALTSELLEPIKHRHILHISLSAYDSNLNSKLINTFNQYSFQSISDDRIVVESVTPINIGPLVRFLEDNKAVVTEAKRHRPSLEDVFVEVTGIEAGIMATDKEKARMGTSNR